MEIPVRDMAPDSVVEATIAERRPKEGECFLEPVEGRDHIGRRLVDVGEGVSCHSDPAVDPFWHRLAKCQQLSLTSPVVGERYLYPA